MLSKPTENGNNELRDLFEPLSSNKGETQFYIRALIEFGYIKEEEFWIARSLTFSYKDILKNFILIRYIVRLETEKIINFSDLKEIVEKNNQDIESIKEALKLKINLEELTFQHKILVMDILDIGVKN